jgi:membrane associated rhomboid family serine protease
MPLDDRDYLRASPSSWGDRWRGVSAFQWLFGLNLAVFVVQWVFRIGWIEDPLSGRPLMPMGGVSADDLLEGRVWTLFTYMFVHGSPGHILVNMLMLWFAGRSVQQVYGPRALLWLYLVTGIAGAVVEMALCSLFLDRTNVLLIGASASCMGLLSAYAWARPREEITLLLAFIIPMRMSLSRLAVGLVGLNVAFGVLAVLGILPGWLSGGGGAVAYFAHVGGAVAGWYGARLLEVRSGVVFREDGGGMRRPQPRRSVQMARANPAASHASVVLKPERRAFTPPPMDSGDLEAEVDAILDKISVQGIASLTEEERQLLERASRLMAGKNGRD